MSRANGLVAAPPALNIEVATVTPDMAANWLARGGKNRTLNARRVTAMVAAMHRGEWRLTGEAIKLDGNGQVRDGQHRLSAVVKSGVAIDTVVVRGVGEPAFDVMDTGRSRTIADALQMHGVVSSHAVSAAVRLLLCYERFGVFYPKTADALAILSTPATLKYLAEHDDVINGVRMGDRIRQVGLRGGTASWGAVLTLCLRLDAEQAYLFTHLLCTGENMSYGHPVLTLRNRMMKARTDASSQSGKHRQEAAALAIKAWNAFRQDRQLQVLVWRDDGPKAEAFPKPI